MGTGMHLVSQDKKQTGLWAATCTVCKLPGRTPSLLRLLGGGEGSWGSSHGGSLKGGRLDATSHWSKAVWASRPALAVCQKSLLCRARSLAFHDLRRRLDASRCNESAVAASRKATRKAMDIFREWKEVALDHDAADLSVRRGSSAGGGGLGTSKSWSPP